MADALAGDSAEPPPLTGIKLLLAGLGLALANFIVILDSSIANVSVPHIAGGLGISPSQGTWVITSYAVADAISVPLTGWLAKRFGTVRSFAFGLIAFGCFSALCGMAWSLGMLVACRILQGFSGGPLMPLSQTLLMRIFPKEKTALALSIWAMTAVCAPIVGPILGGVVSEEWGWPWIFFLNLPVIALCVFLVVRYVVPFETETLRQRVDIIGLALLILWVGAFQFVLDFGRERDWFSSDLVFWTAVAAAIGFIAFLIWELTDREPIVDLAIFRNRGYAVSAFTMAAGYGTFFATVVLVPLWLQEILGYTATNAGYALSLVGVFAVVMAPVVGLLSKRIDIRALICFGVVWLGFTSLLRARWNADADFWTLAFPQLIQGIGMPFFFVGVTTLALLSVSEEETASAAGILSFMRTASGAIGASVAQTLWDNSDRANQVALAGRLNAPEQAMAAMQQSGLSAEQARAALARMVDVQANTLGAIHVFLIGAALFLGVAAIIWLAPRPEQREVGATH